jgi:hypothetical protein
LIVRLRVIIRKTAEFIIDLVVKNLLNSKHMFPTRWLLTFSHFPRPSHRLCSRNFGHSRCILALSKTLSHSGRLSLQDPDTGTGLVCASDPACDDVMRVQIRVRDNIIIESKFQTFGSRSAVATSEYVVGLIEGKTIYEARQITSAEIIDDLSLSYNRHYCCKMV